MKTPSLLSAGALLVLVGPLGAQDYKPPPSQPPDAATLQEIQARHGRLRQRVAQLRKQGVNEGLLLDVEIYDKAITWLLRSNEFYDKQTAAWALDVCDRGLLRGAQLSQGEAPWLQQVGQSIVRAYRSRVDGSLQPFAVTFPADYGKDPRKRWRVDVVLHGRDPSLTEVKFLHQHAGDAAAPRQDFVEIDIFGRGNNAYRWSGEMDVLEAIDHLLATERSFGRADLPDLGRFVLRGFSMGGAGTWHLGLHRPDRWCVLGPGAGFTATHGYVKGLPDRLPPYQEACLTIYDAVDYAENVADVPVVAYAGGDDPQVQAARNIEARLKAVGLSMTLLAAPGLGHTFPPEWRQKAEAEYARYADKGKPEYPRRVRFVTYTLRYAECYWVQLLGLEQHYRQARVDAERTDAGFTVSTANIRALMLTLPQEGRHLPVTIKIDGQTLETRPYLTAAGTQHVYLERRQNQWHAVLPERLQVERLRRLQKVGGLQGPIDDAFMDSFLCVRGTGKPWHEAAARYADEALKRFQADWGRFFRGELPVKEDSEVTPEDIANRHLILFGDPASNSLIEQVLPGLPLRWTRDRIQFAGHDLAAAEYVPVLVYPSPLNTGRYVVLNSGHTFQGADFLGTNALLYPRLGDYALLKLPASAKEPLAAEVVAAGVFDDSWQLAKK